MLRIFLTSTFILALAFICWAEDTVRSVLGVPFGQICAIEAIFIDKPRSYYAQNVATAEYYLKIIKIDNETLREPLIVEPVYENMEIARDKCYKLKAYEIIQSEGVPSEWSDIAQQFSYTVRSKIAVKPI